MITDFSGRKIQSDAGAFTGTGAMKQYGNINLDETHGSFYERMMNQ